MTTPDRVRAPRDAHGIPPRLERDDAEAAARRVLADYARQQRVAGGRGGTRRRGSRVWVVLGLAALGALLGGAVGGLRDLALPLACSMAVVGALLGAISTRR